MNKGELIETLAQLNDIPVSQSRAWLESLLGLIEKKIKKGEDVNITGFGKFESVKRAGRKGRNPATGEAIKVPARNVVAVPDGFSMQQAAAAPTVAVTTWRMLVTRGQVRPGETVLVIGAGGGVNSFTIQLAKLLGATVWVVAGGADKAQQALAECEQFVFREHGT